MNNKISKYEIIELLGEGATAHVYHARDTQLQREVALKVLKPGLVADATAFERFLREAKAAANLFHDHIATVLDMGEINGRYFIAMRYVPGKSLDKILKEEGNLSWEEVLRLTEQIGSALDYAHDKGFLHRDIKPSNIIRDEEGNFWLSDFGLVKAMMSTGLTSHSGIALGTPSYVAPEIWEGEPANASSDLYALTCVLIEALTGEILFSGNTPPAIMKRHFDPITLPRTWPQDIPSGIDKALEKALAKEPGKRYQSALEFVNAQKISVGVKGEQGVDLTTKSGLVERQIGQTSEEQVQADEINEKTGKQPEKKRAQIWLWLVGAFILGAALMLVRMRGVSSAIPAGTSAEEAPAEEAPVEEVTALEAAYAGEYAVKVVTITGPFTDEDAVKFDNTMAPFEEETGIDIQYKSLKEFEATIGARVEAGEVPDIVDFPQPGLLSTFVAAGHVVDLGTFMSRDDLKTRYNESWLDMATMDSPDGTVMAGVWHHVNSKSLVWYPKDDFDAAGYQIPKTWDEMIALGDQIKADGGTPWCVGIESGAATGWPATDWVEEIMLRTTSLENYDKWTKGELKFTSPEVKSALQILSDLWLTKGNVYGGKAAIVDTFYGNAPLPMFNDPPKCWLYKQGNFITYFFPEDAVAGVDYDFFYLPGIDPEYGKPVLVAGDIMAMFHDRPEVRAVMEYFTYGDSVKGWVQSGGAISPHFDSSLYWYTNDVDRGAAEIILNATSVRFDGSDLMPGEVGSGSFWKGMIDYFSGTVDIDTVLEEIDKSWPE